MNKIPYCPYHGDPADCGPGCQEFNLGDQELHPIQRYPSDVQMMLRDKIAAKLEERQRHAEH